MTKGETMIDALQNRILLVDDQPANLNVLRQVLEDHDYQVLLAPSGPVALRNAARAQPDLILLDVMMPEMDGFEVCRRLKDDPETEAIPVIFITARDLAGDIDAGFDQGGVDYITKPFREREVLKRVQTHVRLYRLNRELAVKNAALEQEISQRQKLSGRLDMIAEQEMADWGLEGFVGDSPTIQARFEQTRLMQENAATSVLVTGESGTGKELLARAIHFGSARQEGPFVPVNCAALPKELAESLLFGHVKGAFTGAEKDRAGHFEMAHEGTLFLDEIGEMPLELQAKMLRVLEDGEVWRIGRDKGTVVDVRVVAATNMDLPQQIQAGTFRQDLYFRLARFTVVAPPLRERAEDIPLLAGHFLRLFAREMGRDEPDVEAEALARLQDYAFPGNVRELKNIVERALIESRGGAIGVQHLHFLPEEGTGAAESKGGVELPMDIDEASTRAELWVVKQALGRTDGNLTAAARLLGSNRNRVYRILAQEEGLGPAAE